MNTLLTITATALAATAIGATNQVTDVGNLGGPVVSSFAVTDNGLAAGAAMVPADNAFRAFSGGPGMLNELPPPAPYTQSHAFWLDPGGNTVAVCYNLGELEAESYRFAGTAAQPLGAFTARGASASGSVVVGHRLTTLPTGWTAQTPCALINQALADLPTIGGSDGVAMAVNAAGAIVGSSYTENDMSSRATLWLNSAPIDLGTLGGGFSQAYDLNSDVVVVGIASNAAGQRRAFRFTTDASGAVTLRTDLGALGGAQDAAAYGINDAGDIVGTSGYRAFLYTANAMHDLNEMIPPASGWVLQVASDISPGGVITGWGIHDGEFRAFILTPACAGDLDGDGDVDSTDLNIILSDFGCTAGPGNCPGDLDDDGDTDTTDLNIVLSAFGQSC